MMVGTSQTPRKFNRHAQSTVLAVFVGGLSVLALAGTSLAAPVSQRMTQMFAGTCWVSGATCNYLGYNSASHLSSIEILDLPGGSSWTAVVTPDGGTPYSFTFDGGTSQDCEASSECSGGGSISCKSGTTPHGGSSSCGSSGGTIWCLNFAADGTVSGSSGRCGE
jgi:hypothetical protein